MRQSWAPPVILGLRDLQDVTVVFSVNSLASGHQVLVEHHVFQEGYLFLVYYIPGRQSICSRCPCRYSTSVSSPQSLRRVQVHLFLRVMVRRFWHAWKTNMAFLEGPTGSQIAGVLSLQNSGRNIIKMIGLKKWFLSWIYLLPNF